MRHRTLLLIAAVTGLLACACGGTEAERLHRAAMREYLDPIRPGYEGRNPFWNAFATKFIYAPAFGFEPVESAVKYRFTVSHLGTSMVESPRYRKDAPTEDPEPRRVLGPGVPTGRSWSFEADSPQQSLAPVWNDIPAGRVRVTAEGLDASGRVLGKAGEREFLRDFPFRPPYNGNVRPYAEAARMAALYIHELPAIRRWLTAAEPDMTYRHNTYACKIVGATIQLEVLVAKLLPAHREEALAIARNAARFLMDRSRPEGDPLAFFPPTYYSDLISSSRAENRGKTMTMEACAARNAFLDLYDATGDRICYDRALAIAETYSRLQHADGSFPIKVDFETGEPVNGCKAMLTPVMEYFGRLENQYGVTRYRGCLARAAEWMRRNALESFDLTGQFEDMTVLGQQPYQNLTNCASAPYASWLLKKPGRTAAELADAVDLIRFSEDQFVCWDVLPDDDGVRTLCTPCVYEQYGYRVPVDNSTCVVANALLDLCEATGDRLAFAKAKALADNLTVVQNALDGLIPTSLDVREGAKNRIRGFWVNCTYASILTLLRMAELTGETAGFPADVSHAR